MKLNTTAAPATGTGFTSTSEFKMNMNAKAARVLSDTLYEDKHGSIIRELCSNAFDAHKMVGKEDVPFDVTLPDPFSSMLTIRDYGPGISPEDIETVYSTYFESTKDSDNDSVGMFGLGSKTPFSLTDSFTVTSIYQGVKRVYTAYMNEGMPSISMFGEPEKTDEPNGLEVSVTVDRKHHSAFRDAIVKQLRFFPVKPNVSPDVNWPEIEDVLLEVDGFQYFTHNHNLLRGFFIKTGPVAYPVDFDKLEEHYRHNDEPVPALVTFMRQTAGNTFGYGYGYGRDRNKGAILDMPIGTVEVTPSREGLSYSDHTMQNIVKAIETVKANMFDTVKQRLHDVYSEGYSAFIDYYNKLDDMMLESIDENYVEKNFDPFVVVNGKLSIKMPEKFVGLEVKEYIARYNGKFEIVGQSELADRWWDKEKNIEQDSNGNDVRVDFKDTNEYRTILMFLPGSDKLFFLQDENYAFATRAMNYHDIHGYHGSYYIIKTDKCDASLHDVESFFSQFTSDKSDMVYLSDTPKPSKASSGGFSTTGGRKRSWFDLTNQRIRSSYDLYDRTLYKLNAESEFDLTADDIKDEDEDSIVFFTTFNNRVEAPDTGTHFTHILFNYIQRYKDDGTQIIAVPRNQRKKYDKMVSTIHVDDYIKKYGNEIRTAIRKDMNMVFVNEYNNRIARFLGIKDTTFAHICNGDYTISDDNFDRDNWSNTAASMLAFMNSYAISLSLKELGAGDLNRELEANKEKWENLSSVDEAEKFLTSLGVDFVSFKDKIDTLKDELVNEDNAITFLRDMVKSRHYFCNETKITDPWNSDEEIFDLGELAENLIERLA